MNLERVTTPQTLPPTHTFFPQSIRCCKIVHFYIIVKTSKSACVSFAKNMKNLLKLGLDVACGE